MPDTIAERARLDLKRRGKVLQLVATIPASGDRPAMYSYMVMLDGGQHRANSTREMKRGDDCVLRRYQVRPPLGSTSRTLAPWVTLLPPDAAEELPPESYGMPGWDT
jgi:hypothetical protein